MAKENVKKFKKDFNENAELNEKIRKELEALKDSGKKESKLIPEIAKEFGYEFTEEEFKEDCVSNSKLSDEELANVSGGILGFDEAAPDGNEVTCIYNHYYGLSDYYNRNRVCENCKSKHTKYLGQTGDLECKDCGHITRAFKIANYL